MRISSGSLVSPVPSMMELDQNPLRAKANFASFFNLIWVVQSCIEKYSACAVGQIRSTYSAVPRSQEGRFAIVTNVECGMRWTQWHRETNDVVADGEVVWFWRPDAGAKLVRGKLLLRGDGGYQARHTGEITK